MYRESRVRPSAVAVGLLRSDLEQVLRAQLFCDTKKLNQLRRRDM